MQTQQEAMSQRYLIQDTPIEPEGLLSQNTKNILPLTATKKLMRKNIPENNS